MNDLPASERFFAGGDTSVRGYALDRLGTPETIDRNGFPLGGNAVIVLNAELRVPVWKDIGVVGFVDAGNVFNRVGDFDFGEIRPTTGFGFRYKSPIGPIRVPLYQSLANGGVTVTELHTDITLPIADPERMFAGARAHRRAGFDTFKVKVGRDWRADLASLRAVATAVPDARFRLDAKPASRRATRARCSTPCCPTA